MAIEKARALNMPKENIERAISRGTGELGGAKIEEVLYEAIGPGGIGIIIEAITDNRNRTNSEVKNILQKFGGKLANTGAIQYQFKRMGKVLIEMASQDREKLELAAIDAGAHDFEEFDDILAVYVEPYDLEKAKRALEEKDIKVKEASLSWEPKVLLKIIDPEEEKKTLQLMEALDNLDEVIGVYSNFDIKEEGQ